MADENDDDDFTDTSVLLPSHSKQDSNSAPASGVVPWLISTFTVCLQPQIVVVLVVLSTFFVAWWSNVLSIFAGATNSPQPVLESAGFERERLLERDFKYVLLWSDNGWSQGRNHFTRCPTNQHDQCLLTANRQVLDRSAIVIAGVEDLESIPNKWHRNSEQIWVFYSEKPPGKTDSMRYKGTVNASMTPMRTSEFYVPSFGYARTDIIGSRWVMHRPKNKQVVWITDDCPLPDYQKAYVEGLRKNNISIDIYGACGRELPCEKNNTECVKSLINEYKFALAFESVQCLDFVSDKFSQILQLYDVVPIAMGARNTEYYTALSPPNSFLHVANFSNPEHLASYIRFLDLNEKVYESYLSWKQIYTVTNGKKYLDMAFCKMCDLAFHPEKFPGKSYNISQWFTYKGLCTENEQYLLT